jgi:PAS domain S-box-containing protein
VHQPNTLPQEDLQALITALEDIVFLLDNKGAFLNVWVSDERKLFMPREDFIGKTIFDIKPEIQAKLELDAIDKVLNGEPFIDIEYSSPYDETQHFAARFKRLSGNADKVVVSIRDISRQKAEQDAIKRNEEKYLKLIQNSQDVITVIDAEGKVLFDSFSVYTQFGYKEKIEGKSVFSFVHPEDQQLAKEVFANAMKTEGISGPFEFRFITADGSYRYVECLGNNLFHEPGINGYVINSRDITDRRNIEVNLAMTNARLNTIIESTDAIIFAVDTNLNYIAFNQRHKATIKQLYGTDIEIGQHALVYTTDAATNDREWLKPNLLRALNGEQFSLPYEVKSGDAIVMVNDISFNPIVDKTGVVTGVAVFAKDVTQIVQISREYEKAKNEAEAAARAKSEFLSNMSHEIRTPINAIMGMTDLLLEQVNEPEALEYLRSIKYSSDNLLVIINDILDFSKIEAGKVNLEKIDFNLYERLDAVTRIFSIKAKEKGLTFDCSISENVPRFVKGDPYRLNQILLNLIGNAIKFTQKGSIELKVKNASETTHQVKLEFVVQDTGIGIPEDKIGFIFESFNQAYTDITRRFGGTGLGLAITQKLTHLMGGSISVQSKQNIGSTFTVTLSFEKTNIVEDDRLQSHSEQSRDLRNKRILIVEDNSLNQMVLKHILASWHATFEVAENGTEAIALLADHDFDIVLMDLQMPEMSGYEATQFIRNKNTPVRNPLIPIIAITADAFPETRRRVLETGMNDFVSKPFEKDELYNKIMRLCK